MGLFEITKKPGDNSVEMHAFQQKDFILINKQFEALSPSNIPNAPSPLISI